MRAYLSAAAVSAAFLAWLMSGLGREGASEARDAPVDLDLRRGAAEGASAPEATAAEPAAIQRRPVRIVYPPPYEPR